MEDVARECGVSKHTIYAGKARFGGVEASEVQNVRALEDENGRLERLVADLSSDREMLKAVIANKRPELVDRRTYAGWLREGFQASERRVCGLMSVAVSRFRYCPGDRMKSCESGSPGCSGRSRVMAIKNLFDARIKISAWKEDYNEVRPDRSLSYRTPAEFARTARTESYGKDAGFAYLENAHSVSHFATAPAAG